MDYAIINLEGRAVADPVARQSKDGGEFATFSIAVNQHSGGRDLTSYYDCVVPGHMYQTMQKAGVGKGSALSVTGRQTVRTYKGRDGSTGTSVNVSVLDWRFEGSRPRSSGAQPESAPGAGETGQKTGSILPPLDLQDEDDLPV